MSFNRKTLSHPGRLTRAITVDTELSHGDRCPDNTFLSIENFQSAWYAAHPHCNRVTVTLVKVSSSDHTSSIQSPLKVAWTVEASRFAFHLIASSLKRSTHSSNFVTMSRKWWFRASGFLADFSIRSVTLPSLKATVYHVYCVVRLENTWRFFFLGWILRNRLWYVRVVTWLLPLSVSFVVFDFD